MYAIYNYQPVHILSNSIQRAINLIVKMPAHMLFPKIIKKLTNNIHILDPKYQSAISM